MTFSKSNDQLTGRKPALFPAGCEVVAERFELDLATGDLALNTIGAVGILPAGCGRSLAGSRATGDLGRSGIGTGAQEKGCGGEGEQDRPDCHGHCTSKVTA